MHLLIDEDSQATKLVESLKSLGHDVFTINDLGMAGTPDDEVLATARKINRVLLTHNCSDFKDLHENEPNHAGILLVRRSSDKSKDMNYQDIVRAVSNVERASIELVDQCVELNHWRY